jgi:hypothetical protein
MRTRVVVIALAVLAIASAVPITAYALQSSGVLHNAQQTGESQNADRQVGQQGEFEQDGEFGDQGEIADDDTEEKD